MTQGIDHSPSDPPVDARTQVRHGQLAYDLPTYPTLAAWEARAAHLRRRILTAAGLWPTPERSPLRPRVTGRIEHGDYSIENVFFESWPGFYVCGNLYRPRSGPADRQGPFPGVLCPHGHYWTQSERVHGRLGDQELGSVPGLCISFARQGYFAFAYDMIGYNDAGAQLVGGAPEQADDRSATQLPDGGLDDDGLHRRHFHSPGEFLWGVSLLGLQLWNSVRALDYLASLPDIDRARLACTGASGGGTQTFLLCAVDERVRVAAPVNMVSAHFQGGCVCENAPNLRLDCTNVEFAALMAPRPLLMVSATGDWTANTPEVEYPAVRAIYRLYGAEERAATVQVDAPHNYNRRSREAVYAWFGRWLPRLADDAGERDAEALKERPYRVDPPERMRVFRVGPERRARPAAPSPEERGMETAATVAEEAATPGRERGVEVAPTLPDEAATAEQLTGYLIGQARAQAEALAPRDAATLHAYRETMGVAYRYALNARLPSAGELRVERVTVDELKGGDGVPPCRVERLILGRKEAGERTPGLLLVPRNPVGAALVVHPEGVQGAAMAGQERGTETAATLVEGTASIAADGLIARLLARRLAVLTLDAWGSGELAAVERDKTVDHFLCFNRSDAALRVQDVLNGIAALDAGAGLDGRKAPGTGTLSGGAGTALAPSGTRAMDAPERGAESGLVSGAVDAPERGAESGLVSGAVDAPERGAESRLVSGAVDAPGAGAWSDAKSGAGSRILPVHLVGLGIAGLWCLLARALCGGGDKAHVARTVVDAAQFACEDDPAWLDVLYLPHIRRAGDLRTAAALIAPGPLYVHNAAPGFPTTWVRQVYRAAAAPGAVHIQAQEADVETMLDWIGRFQVSV